MKSGIGRIAAIHLSQDHGSIPTIPTNDNTPVVVHLTLPTAVLETLQLQTPRLLSRPEAAAYCGVTVETFDDYRRRGIVPGPVEGTSRWDRRLIDEYLDKASGIDSASGSSLDGWRAKRNG